MGEAAVVGDTVRSFHTVGTCPWGSSPLRYYTILSSKRVDRVVYSSILSLPGVGGQARFLHTEGGQKILFLPEMLPNLWEVSAGASAAFDINPMYADFYSVSGLNALQRRKNGDLYIELLQFRLRNAPEPGVLKSRGTGIGSDHVGKRGARLQAAYAAAQVPVQGKSDKDRRRLVESGLGLKAAPVLPVLPAPMLFRARASSSLCIL